jgi:hypothetical protein
LPDRLASPPPRLSTRQVAPKNNQAGSKARPEGKTLYENEPSNFGSRLGLTINDPPT